MYVYLYFVIYFYIFKTKDMNKKWIINIFFIAFLVNVHVHGQKALYKAKLQYDAGAFTDAKNVLEAWLAENPGDVTAHVQLAECHFALAKWSECIARLEKIVHLTNCPAEAYLLYGNVLKQAGRFQEARDNFAKYAISHGEDGNKRVKDIDFAVNALTVPSKFDLVSMPFNSSADDFGLTFYNNVPVFSSFRSDILMDDMQKASNHHEGVQKSYYYTNKKHHFIRGLNQKLDHIGPVSFSSNGEYCALVESDMTTDCNIRCDKKNGVLYLVKVNKTGEITEHKPFVHNEVNASVHSAHIAYDGKALYFSSNRAGGFGGFDMYVSYLKDGIWTLPVNLGPEVNTAGNEITPYYNNGEMYFASDEHTGIGGYDIFRTRVINGQWTDVTNMGHGINSIGDDYFPAMNSKGEIFLTSNRLGGKGGNDIYKAIPLSGDETPLLSAVSVDLVPPAFSLESLEETKAADTQNTRAVAMKNEEAVKTSSVFVMPEFDRNLVGSPEAEFSLTGARRIALGNIAPTGEVFFIQLASVSQLEPNISKYRPLIQYGNIYKMNVGNLIKIRLGYFTERKEAEEALKNVRRSGFPDAFIIRESLVHSNMELLLSREEDESGLITDENKVKTYKENPKVYGLGGKYKVRLASYEDPIWFDINKVKDLGRIEQWTKGTWTIFILAGYENIDQAKEAQIKALNRGFKTAEVVIDNGGILERLKQN